MNRYECSVIPAEAGKIETVLKTPDTLRLMNTITIQEISLNLKAGYRFSLV